MRSGTHSIAAMVQRPWVDLLHSQSCKQWSVQGSILYSHATRSQHSSVLHPPDEHLGVSFPLHGSNCYITKSFSPSLFRQITQGEVYDCLITQVSCGWTRLSLLCISAFPRWATDGNPMCLFPQASPLVPSSSPRKFLFCWHPCGCCNCS